MKPEKAPAQPVGNHPKLVIKNKATRYWVAFIFLYKYHYISLFSKKNTKKSMETRISSFVFAKASIKLGSGKRIGYRHTCATGWI
ncbi:hypothetical protein [Flavobacterium sp. FlaQc-28]|uniref:hypothetical protein n=1 Tax=Flavobacterium sp. FlaQc-28 TaxID=3374178 RepID=UPI003756597E